LLGILTTLRHRQCAARGSVLKLKDSAAFEATEAPYGFMLPSRLPTRTAVPSMSPSATVYATPEVLSNSSCAANATSEIIPEIRM